MTEIKYDGSFIQVVKEGNWEYVTRKVGKKAVVVVPVQSNCIWLLDEYRVPFGDRVLGLPAGLVGDISQGEDVFSAARRELVEETGMQANSRSEEHTSELQSLQ